LVALAAAWDAGVITPPWVGPSISGYVFADLNGNTVRDWGEPGLGGWRIVEAADIDILDDVATTNGNGFYRISDVSPGRHAIRPDRMDLLGSRPETRWYFTFPAGFWREVELEEGESKRGVNFGLREVGDSTVFYGRAWVDGRLAPDGSELEALVDGKVCARSRTQDEYFAISVSSGCGQEGRGVEFKLAGQAVDWVRSSQGRGLADYWPSRRPGTAEQIYLGAGEPFAVLRGTVWAYQVPGAPGSLKGLPVKALIGDTVCGEDTMSVGQVAGFEMVVPGASLVPGCGVEGATVTFQVGDRLANESVGWSPGLQSQQVTVGEPPPPTPSRTPWPTPSPEPPGSWTRTPTPWVTPTPSPRPSLAPTHGHADSSPLDDRRLLALHSVPYVYNSGW